MKWLGGIGFFFALSATLLLFNLSSLTERDKAVNVSATIVASLFSREGLDDEKGLQELRAKAASLPGDTIAPIPQFSFITISKQDLEHLNARDLRIKIFSQLTAPIYDKGLDKAAASFTSNPADQEKFRNDAFALGAFTKTTHDALHAGLIIALIAAILTAAELIYFSAGWGRLVSPGIVLLLASPVGTIFSLFLLHPPTDGTSPVAKIPASVTQTVGDTLAHSYLLAAILGGSLLASALIGKITTNILRRRSANS